MLINTYRYKCPECGNTERFLVDVPVIQRWVVNSNADYIDTIEDFVEMIHDPEHVDFWECDKCGYVGERKEFRDEYSFELEHKERSEC